MVGLPVISMLLRVFTTDSIISSGMCDSLLLWRFKVSRELRFSKASEGITLILKEP
jgi:hypothetical protein